MRNPSRYCNPEKLLSGIILENLKKAGDIKTNSPPIASADYLHRFSEN